MPITFLRLKYTGDVYLVGATNGFLYYFFFVLLFVHFFEIRSFNLSYWFSIFFVIFFLYLFRLNVMSGFNFYV